MINAVSCFIGGPLRKRMRALTRASGSGVGRRRPEAVEAEGVNAAAVAAVVVAAVVVAVVVEEAAAVAAEATRISP
jgi:hypothetical protein